MSTRSYLRNGMPFSRVERSLAELQIAWKGNRTGSVDAYTFWCFGFPHHSVGAAIRHLNGTKCCVVKHSIYDCHRLLDRLPPEKKAA